MIVRTLGGDEDKGAIFTGIGDWGNNPVLDSARALLDGLTGEATLLVAMEIGCRIQNEMRLGWGNDWDIRQTALCVEWLARVVQIANGPES